MHVLVLLFSFFLVSQAATATDLFDLFKAKQNCLGVFEADLIFLTDIINKEKLSQNDIQSLKNLIHIKDNRGNTVIHHLAAKGQLDKIIELHKKIENIGLEIPNNVTWTPATTAYLFDHKACFEGILKLLGVHFPQLKEDQK